MYKAIELSYSPQTQKSNQHNRIDNTKFKKK